MAGIAEAARAAVKHCAAVKPGERVLIVADARTEKVARALLEAASFTEAYLIQMPVGERHGAEPPKLVADAMKKFDVVFCPTTFSLTHTRAVKQARKNARIATLPGVTEEMFARAMSIDYDALAKQAGKLAELLGKTDKVLVESVSGTNLTFSVGGRKPEKDLGVFDKRGDVTNLPAGEMYIAPVEGTANGALVIDHMADLCRPKTRLAIHNGLVQEVDGDDDFRKRLWGYRNGRNIAEFGMGLNPKAVVSGKILEDEKVLGTCHVALGSSFAIGGRVKADIHWDAILLTPTVFFDDKKVMDGGELLV